jgi:dihydrodiol dehydrogenase / D-xylose 1-dehydrogenase (NADP)
MTETNELILRWGIISAGIISNDFCTALRSFKNNCHVLQAVGARNLADAKKFAERFQIPSHYGSYDEVINDPNVNMVYIGTINLNHKEVCLKAINAGKHVLCKKNRKKSYLKKVIIDECIFKR